MDRRNQIHETAERFQIVCQLPVIKMITGFLLQSLCLIAGIGICVEDVFYGGVPEGAVKGEDGKFDKREGYKEKSEIFSQQIDHHRRRYPSDRQPGFEFAVFRMRPLNEIPHHGIIELWVDCAHHSDSGAVIYSVSIAWGAGTQAVSGIRIRTKRRDHAPIRDIAHRIRDAECKIQKPERPCDRRARFHLYLLYIRI